ncbi:exodeoxyribonuclease V subunit alpha [Rheinheimera riviphila]|uniref:RecBCD enzyme subunit RecD n=2 Tax=Rheinheimera riviphila TaxID=1834037 RepID=A0A437R3J7_9GAMM|nr:exodeoxyribonuclease V subunit alpha [Rheinheimera riviphila]
MPKLQRWQQLGLLRPLDVVLVQMLQSKASELPPAVSANAMPDEFWLWLALGSSQLAQGHLCLDLAQAFVKPDSLQNPGQFAKAVSAELNAFVRTQQLPQLLVLFSQGRTWVEVRSSELSDPDLHSPASTPFVLSGERLYLRRYWQYEQHIADFIQQSSLLTQQLRQQFPASQVQRWLTQLFPVKLFPAAKTQAQQQPDWQQLACAMAVSSRFAVITGGPGTGKTTTVVKLLLLLQQAQQEQKAQQNGQNKSSRPLTIRLAAPTGKAAARLSLSVTLALKDLTQKLDWDPAVTGSIPTEAQTLHRLLGSGPDRAQFRYHRDFPLPLDVLVVDEASMVDVAMFAAMLQALPASARLILLGDKDQLASVEAGAVMAELCRDAQQGGYSQQTADWLTTLTGQQLPATFISPAPQLLEQQLVMLRTSHRFGADSGIGQLATAVNLGDDTTALQILQQPPADLRWLQFSPESADFSHLVQHGSPHQALAEGFAGYLALVKNPPAATASSAEYDRWALAVLQKFASFQVLAAVRQGKFGVEQLNARIAAILAKQQLIPRTEGWYPGRPVMVVQNDYSTGLMNGDVGICLPRAETAAGEPQLRVVFISADPTTPVRWLLPSRLPQVETVYAMTVHKSQGSEFGHVVLVLPEQGSRLLNRELIYTGITRAAQQFSLLCADGKVLQQAVLQRNERSGGLRLSSL